MEKDREILVSILVLMDLAFESKEEIEVENAVIGFQSLF